MGTDKETSNNSTGASSKTVGPIPHPPPAMRIPGRNEIATAAYQNSSKKSTNSPELKSISLGFDDELKNAIKYA